MLLFVMLPVRAMTEHYKNDLIKVTLEKTSSDDVNVTLQTENLYPNPIYVMQKKDMEYVIVLSETYNSNQTNVDFSNVKNIIKKVDVQLLPYEEKDEYNGYTQILITTVKPIKFFVTNQALSENINNSNASSKEKKQPMGIRIKESIKFSRLFNPVAPLVYEQNEPTDLQESPKHNKIRKKRLDRKSVV